MPQLLTLSFNLSRKAKEKMQGSSWNFYSVYIKFCKNIYFLSLDINNFLYFNGYFFGSFPSFQLISASLCKRDEYEVL